MMATDLFHLFLLSPVMFYLMCGYFLLFLLSDPLLDEKTSPYSPHPYFSLVVFKNSFNNDPLFFYTWRYIYTF